MSFSIDTFTAKLGGGGALASLFEAELTTSRGPEQQSATDDFKFLCKATTLPGDTIDVATVTYMGRGINIPSNRAAVQWTTTVYNDEQMQIRNNIESWMEQLNSHKTNVRAANMSKINRLVSVAPMMDCTDRHERYFLRLISKNVLLYTEMIVSEAIDRGDKKGQYGKYCCYQKRKRKQKSNDWRSYG